MPVDPEISRLHLRQELALVEDLVTTHKWGVTPDYERLVVVVTMCAHTGDLFIVEARCDDYKELPPFFEFIDPVTGERGTRHAYPKTTDSFFHDSGPCICAPFSRKAYKAIVATGPHGDDWKLGDWQTSTASSVQWSNYSKLGDMLGLIHTRVSRSDWYKGRMA
jgi:hypothetical protein